MAQFDILTFCILKLQRIEYFAPEYSRLPNLRIKISNQLYYKEISFFELLFQMRPPLFFASEYVRITFFIRKRGTFHPYVTPITTVSN